jgi:hypothetical protein
LVGRWSTAPRAPSRPGVVGRRAAAGPAGPPAPGGRSWRFPPGHRIGDPGRVPPAGVEREPVGRLPVRQAFQPLQHHHHGQDRGRHRAAPDRSNRSANSSGGNSRPRSPARNRYTDPAGSAASHQRAPVVGSPGRLRQWSSPVMISSGAAGSWLSITTSAIRVGGRRSGSGAGRGCSVAVSRLGGLGRPEQHTVACTARRVSSI